MKADSGNQHLSQKISQKTTANFGNFFICLKYAPIMLFYSSYQFVLGGAKPYLV
jgi:hypothetical protein